MSFSVRVGYIWLFLTLANEWLISALQRAMGESPLLFNIVIAMLVGSLAIKYYKIDGKSNYASLLWLMVFGIFTGLAGQSKLNGLAIFPAGIVILILLTLKCIPHLRWRYFLIGLIGLIIFTFIFFVGPNPFLWSNPIGRTIQTLQYRIDIMHGYQAAFFPEIVVKGWRDNIRIDIIQIFINLTPIKFVNSQYLKMILACLGFCVLFSVSWSSYVKKSSLMNAGALSILLVGILASLPNLFTPLNIDRYFLLPVYFASIFIAIGFDWLLKYIGKPEADKTDGMEITHP
jgi:hypothetical protein